MTTTDGGDSRTWTMSLRSGSLASADWAKSIYGSEFAVPVNSVKHIAQFFFAPDLYLKRGRTTQIVYLTLIVATAMLIVYIQLGMMAEYNRMGIESMEAMTYETRRIKTSQIMMATISRERYAVIQYLLAPTTARGSQLEQAWQAVFEASYQIVNTLPLWPIQTSPEFADYTQNNRLYTVEVEGHRSNVKQNVNATTVEMAYYTGVLQQFLNSISYSLRGFNAGLFWPEAAGYLFLSLSRFEVDRVRTVLTVGDYNNRTDVSGADRVYKEATRMSERGPVLGRNYLEMALKYADSSRPIESVSSRDCQLCRAQAKVFDNSYGLNPKNFITVNTSYYEWEAKVTPFMDLFAEDLNIYSHASTDQQQLIIVDIVITIFTSLACILVTYSIWRLNQVFLEIRDRTDQLRGKTEEADSLLYQMLPMAVAKMLKEGGTIAPEFFEEATVYFNDVYGFHEFVSASEPSKIVSLLNNLYRSLDERIELYGCYKVETVSDTYMVVAGVPKRRNDHAAAIALMALDMVETARQIPMGDGFVRIRVGLNSGPVFAGVVGLVMPRYCLFGDTVNTASRMESTSKPLHVHCSEKTCIMLRRHGGFNLEYRGKVPVKGKGEMKTYWLRSAEATTVMTAAFGLEKPPPNPDALDEGVALMGR